MDRPQVVFGMLGTQLDSGSGPGRWEKWRPTVALGMHEDFLLSRLELLTDLRRYQKLAEVVREDLGQVSPETQVQLHDTYLVDPWDFEGVYATLHDFFAGYAFRPDEEDYYLHITTGSHVSQICGFLLTESRHFPGRLLQTSPPRKQGSGEAGAYTVIDLDLSRYDRIAQRFQQQQLQDRALLKSGIATRNAAFNRMIEQIETVATRSREPMLLMGPTGAGKSQLAKRVFELKKLKHQLPGRFVEVNCATLRGDGAMSALFGHTKGAYTGAVSDRPGLLRSAHQGLLFLDEIGELGLDEQAMLLRALEEKRFLPVGSDREVDSEFQLIAGTNRDLHQHVAQGRFREDLLARLNLWTYHLPGLAERRQDIEPNLDFELERWSREQHQRVTFNREARSRYLAFATGAEARWSGNFRDLSASVMRLATLANAGRIQLELVEEEIARLRRQWRDGTPPSPLDALLGEAAAQLDRFDRVQLEDVVRVCATAKSLSQAGRELFAVSRTQRASTNDADRLRKYLARFGLDWEQVREGGRTATQD
ncbi:Anaerobic nitric oxide reductase transcription regulator NorR [Xanthomonas sacchari]|uniref:RNA repair transcriptional activator RtcR n=1 Tax=Xanthomonas sacchari TaxID=56458 RepID=UPI0022554D8C|nr:RNA repair transcriptional activator RtcR [Xanthomonas sacchari]MCW0365942.1 Anaerobic nitric oxide reductase transcription regulator NorR [Xanthomonas sacchari]MCW0440006.1 Anaerobic nitric oxide reductase transcription regulator NorR [Xanthomonas sacchari]